MRRSPSRAHDEFNPFDPMRPTGLLWTLGDPLGIKKLRDNMKYHEESDTFGIQQDIILDGTYVEKNFLQRICNGLVSHGYRVWFPTEINHERFSNFSPDRTAMLERKLKQCDLIASVVVCLSEHYERSNVCRAVLQYALKKRLKIIPVIIQKHYKMQNYLEDIFGQTEVINFTQLAFEDAIDLLAKCVDDLHKTVPQIVENFFSINITLDLFDAVKRNSFSEVKEYLSQITLAHINKIQTNGTTILHAAVVSDNKDIVRLILNKGASRSIRDSIDKKTPNEAVRSEAVKRLFKRPNLCHRFLTDLSYQLCEWSTNLLSFVNQPLVSSTYDEILITIRNVCLSSHELSSNDKMMINWFLDQAIIDPVYILRVFTSVTNFSIIVNQYIFENGYQTTDLQNASSSLSKCSWLEPFTYLGETYRGILLSKGDVTKYSVGSKVKITAFLSTTTDWSLAELAALDGQGDYWRRTSDFHISYFAGICIYRIKHHCTAYTVQDISEVPDEQEVIIFPCSVFRVKVVRQYDEAAQNGIIYIFELEQCDHDDV
ncbi:unnamed protein product [Adineta steineri]|uniref:TIR domain-containing protein n=1 Tax=Adineta steineri TaxID=433720 RepID=A0A815TEZ2_9BILA|nr:unnamed protein product [Adineta steineri]CAF3710003.1 unnamed protein product [Adineta steineri]